MMHGDVEAFVPNGGPAEASASAPATWNSFEPVYESKPVFEFNPTQQQSEDFQPSYQQPNQH